MSGICVQEIATGRVYEWPANVPFPPDYKDRYRIVDCPAGAAGGLSPAVWVGLAALALVLLSGSGRRR